MPENSSTTISDTSVLIILTRINKLEILQKIYNNITVTREVLQEYNLSLPAWFKEENPSINYKSNTRLRSLDPGEASSIALALEKKNCLLVVDELPARRIALEFNLQVAGPWAYYLKQKREN